MFLYTTGFVEISIVKLLILDSGMEVIFVIDIDLDDVNEVAIYEAYNVDGNESEALNDIYLELFEIIVPDEMLKLLK